MVVANGSSLLALECLEGLAYAIRNVLRRGNVPFEWDSWWVLASQGEGLSNDELPKIANVSGVDRTLEFNLSNPDRH